MSRPAPSIAALLTILTTAAALGFLGSCAPATRAPDTPIVPHSPADTTPPPSPPPAVAVPAPAPAPDTMTSGVVHYSTWRPEGPWAIHVVEVDPAACGVRLRTAAALDGVVGAETTTSLARRAGPGQAPALVGINADFFRADPPGVPEGPQVAAGEVVVAEGTFGPSVATRFSVPQPVFGVARGPEPFVGEAAVAGSVWTVWPAESSSPAGSPGSPHPHPHPHPHPLFRLNAPPGPDSLALFNRFAAPRTPPAPGVVEAVVRIAIAAAAAGDTARAVVVRIDTLSAGVPVPADGAVLAGRGTAAGWLRSLAPGDSVAWTLPFAGAPGPVEELVGGFPLLLRDGEPVLDRVPAIREAFAARRHPRSAVAIRPDGTVLLVVVDGRQPGYSDGMTLPELTDLLLELGATDALNLDGGGSTALVLRGSLVNRPSDPAERPVANALLVLGPAPGECPAPGP